MYREKLNQPEDVKKYYDEWTDRFLDMSGMAFQANRTSNVDDMFNYFIRTIGIKENQSVLEAGCGVGGPLTAFAKKVAANFTGVTISPRQISLANRFLNENRNNLKGKLSFVEGDYHNLSSLFPEQSFDHVLFLESLGHANDPGKVISEVFTVLKEGGTLYIKDCYSKLSTDPSLQEKIDEAIKATNRYFYYNTLEVSEILDILRRTGFELFFLRPPQYQNDPTEANAFLEKHNIPQRSVDAMNLYEIKCYKPFKKTSTV